ncbi:restriction endonuclease [Micrococcus terreus]|uniref:Restriction endonuclease n=1 Tax=Micrococcus terreus TaxID=574650 RepID=A0A1I7MRN6_9MICC|nr:restriction endonuclease [Micrococcus terreus]SFV24597.1 Restriction endonuclease [Micrococcus terreus]
MDPEEQAQDAVTSLNETVRAELLERLQGSTPAFFEEAVVNLLMAMGYGGTQGRAAVTGKAHDGGIDGVIDGDALGLDRVYVQAKRYAEQNTVGREPIQAFVGALHLHGATKGVFITTSSFSKHAQAHADAVPNRIVLIDEDFFD